MSKVSVVIPSRNERFLQPTILDVLKKAEGDVEVIAILDGYEPPKEEIVKDSRVIYIHKTEPEGMRAGINSGVERSTGDYIYKLDGHCLMSQGWDVGLVKDYQPRWVVIPQRRRLDAENWCEQIQENPKSKPHIDYERLSFPSDSADWGGAGLNGRIWTERILERQGKPEYDIDDNMSFQGSSWFTSKQHFIEAKIFEDKRWGTFWNEAQNISFRTVLCGETPGAVMVNKKVFYCHLHKGKKFGRGYKLNETELTKGRDMAMRFFQGEKVWGDQTRPLSFLIERFMPLPEWDLTKLNELKERERKNGWNV